MSAQLTHAPISIRRAKAYVREHHRHCDPPVGAKFCIASYDGNRLCGVAFVEERKGRGNRKKGDPPCLVAEVTRVATDGTGNACSFLLGKAKRLAQAAGYRRVITTNLESETGVSLKAGGWKEAGLIKPRRWDTPTRRRKHRAIEEVPKRRWVQELCA